jgi:hypothetical protein
MTGQCGKVSLCPQCSAKRNRLSLIFLAIGAAAIIVFTALIVVFNSKNQPVQESPPLSKEDLGRQTAQENAQREKEAATALELSRTLIAEGKLDSARFRLRKFLKRYAGTEAANKGEQLLKKLDK